MVSKLAGVHIFLRQGLELAGFHNLSAPLTVPPTHRFCSFGGTWGLLMLQNLAHALGNVPSKRRVNQFSRLSFEGMEGVSRR